MKMNLPLPKTEKQIAVSNETVQKLGWPFNYAQDFNQADVNYIENTIKTHKLYKTVQQNNKSLRIIGNDAVRSLMTIINFLKPFANDSKCPANLQSFLCKYIDSLQNCVQNENSGTDVVLKNFMVNSWMERARR